MNHENIVVIGGGLAGLTAAFLLRAHQSVILLEAGPRFGGQIDTTHEHGFVVERGGEGFVARSQALPKLVADLGMSADTVIGQATLRSFGYDGDSLRSLAPGEAAAFLGFQVAASDFGKGICSLRDGMGSLVSALAGALQGHVDARLNARALSVERGAGPGRLRVRLSHGAVLDAGAVIVATTAAAASDLLADLSPEPARALALAATQSSVTVELAYPAAAISHALDGTGFVVTQDAQRDGMRACTFTSSKFADRAPRGRASMRAFFRPTHADLGLDDATFIARAVRGIGRVLPVHGEPLHAWVSRWPNALPAFDEAHRARVAALESALEPARVYLAGSAFHGSGIDVAVRSGEHAAARISG